MCLNPLKITNKSYFRLGGPRYIEVPCGNCPECSNVKQIDYFLRVYAQFKDLCPLNKPTNWSCWFVTLTFNDENLPKSRTAIKCMFTKQIDKQFTKSHYKVFGSDIYEVSDDYRPCFDHRILQRFTKSYRQFFRRENLPEPHMIFTSEFGSKYGRPHYHGIIFVPKQYNAWYEFRDELARFWHYGFSYNSQLSTLDGITTKRSTSTAIKYVLKYITKNDMVLPEYLNHGNDCILHDVPKESYTPRVFTTNGFGVALESMLTHDNYVMNSVNIAVETKDGIEQYKQFNIPAYYRRRYFQRSEVISSSILIKPTYWDGYKKFYHKKQQVFYQNGFEAIRKETFASKFKQEYQTATLVHQSSITENQYVNFRFRQVEYDYSSYTPFVWCYKSLLLDPILDSGFTLENLKNPEYYGIIQKKYLFLCSSNGNITNYGRLHSSLDTSNPAALDVLCSDLRDCRSRSLLRRKKNYAYEREDKERFYESHDIVTYE